MSALAIPEVALVALVGVTGSGKSTFAARNFLPTEVISSDVCRALVSDDADDQAATTAAYAVLHAIAGQRLALGRLTVVDATSVRPEDRRPLVALAREHHVLPVAIVLDLPASVCHERNADRPDRTFGRHVVRSQQGALRRSLRSLQREGFRRVHVLRTPGEVDAATVVREPLWTTAGGLTGPFDLVGDVVLDGGALVVCHAGLPEAVHNRASGAVRSFALYGDTTGETDEFGLPCATPGPTTTAAAPPWSTATPRSPRRPG